MFSDPSPPAEEVRSYATAQLACFLQPFLGDASKDDQARSLSRNFNGRYLLSLAAKRDVHGFAEYSSLSFGPGMFLHDCLLEVLGEGLGGGGSDLFIVFARVRRLYVFFYPPHGKNNAGSPDQAPLELGSGGNKEARLEREVDRGSYTGIS